MPAIPPMTAILEHGVVVADNDYSIPLKRIASMAEPTFQHGFHILDRDGSSLNHAIESLLRPVGPHAVAAFLEESDLRYCISCMAYHFGRIVERYIRGCALFEDHHDSSVTASGNHDDPVVFFEVDALLTVGRRVYEALRKVLWKHYAAGRRGRWRSIRATLDAPELPSDFRDVLHDSWSMKGKSMSDYRDCIAHYDSLNNGLTTCWMQPINGRWAMSVKLPIDPSKGRGLHGFELHGGPDALAYSYECLLSLVHVCRALELQPVVQQFLRKHS